MKNKLKEVLNAYLNAYFTGKKQEKQEGEAIAREWIGLFGKNRVQLAICLGSAIYLGFVLAVASYVVGLIHFLVTGAANLDGWGCFVVLLMSLPFLRPVFVVWGIFQKTMKEEG